MSARGHQSVCPNGAQFGPLKGRMPAGFFSHTRAEMRGSLEPPGGIEPPTYSLRVNRSAD